MRTCHRSLPLAGLSVLAAFGCGKKDSASPGLGYQDKTSTYAGLAFTTTDTKFTSSQFLYDDFSTGNIKVLSAGESGDPWMKWVGGRLYFFNRSQTSLNYRWINPAAPTAEMTTQTATPAAALGDPHDAVLLDAHRMLLAHWTAGQILVIDPDTGATVQTVDAAWDVGSGASSQLRPNAFYVSDNGDGTKTILVLHQGMDKNFAPDGSQAIFWLKDDGKTVTAVDLDTAKDKVQGKAVDIRSPATFFPAAAAGQVMIYGECTAFDDASCKSGFETVDLASHAVTFTFDTGSLGLKGNGGAIKGAGNDYYALMTKGDSQNPTRVVEKIDFAGKTSADVYTFKGTSGCCALYFDDSSTTLYVGDFDPSTSAGFWSVLAGGSGEPKTVALPGIPYTAAFVPKG